MFSANAALEIGPGAPGLGRRDAHQLRSPVAVQRKREKRVNTGCNPRGWI